MEEKKPIKDEFSDLMFRENPNLYKLTFNNEQKLEVLNTSQDLGSEDDSVTLAEGKNFFLCYGIFYFFYLYLYFFNFRHTIWRGSIL